MTAIQSTVKPVMFDATTPMDCALLSLPAELREEIYHFAFSQPTHDSDSIDLLDAQPPTKGLLLACRQINVEGGAIYKTAYRRYWVNSSFSLDYRRTAGMFRGATKAALLAKETSITHIKDLRVTMQDSQIWDLGHSRGGWKLTLSDGRVRYVRLRVWLNRQGIDPTRLAWYGHQDESSVYAAAHQYCSRLTLVEQILLLPTASI